MLALLATVNAAGPSAGDRAMLYLASALTVAALGYLGYAMIRPEKF